MELWMWTSQRGRVCCLLSNSIRFHSLAGTPAQRSKLSSDETLFSWPMGRPASGACRYAFPSVSSRAPFHGTMGLLMTLGRR